MSKLTGQEAIDYAAESGLKLNKHTDPTEEARDDVAINEAEDIIREDPNLIWIEATCEIAMVHTTSRTSFDDLEVGEGVRFYGTVEEYIAQAEPIGEVVSDDEPGCGVYGSPGGVLIRFDHAPNPDGTPHVTYEVFYAEEA